MDAQVLEKLEAAPSLAGRVAIVTGSTSGIGLGVAKALAAAGADVVLNGFGDRDEIDYTCAGIERDTGARVEYDDANLMDPMAAAGLVTRAIAGFGRIDILVNNAGIQFVSPIEEFPVEKWDAILALNLSAAFHTSKAAFAEMKA